MITVRRTDSNDPEFIKLVEKLDAELAERDGTDHSFYHQFNSIDTIKHVVVAYDDNLAVSCGAIKYFDTDSMEVKRMYTLPEFRGKGIAAKVLEELEKWAGELGHMKCILETGKRNPEAIRLYEKNGYHKIPNYGQYEGVEDSVCFEKRVIG